MDQRFIIQVKFQRFIPPSFEYLQGWRFHQLFEPVLVEISFSSFFFLVSNQNFLTFIFGLLFLILPVWISEEPLASSPHSPHGVVGCSFGLLFWRHPITSVTLHWPHSSTSEFPVHSSCPDTGVVTQQLVHKTLYTAVRQQNVSNVLFLSYFCSLTCDLSS